MLTDYPAEYYEFFIKFNEGDYYTCHDLLEDMWMTDKGNLFLKGLLQMSVAIYHYSYGNVKGARLMMQAAHDYLQAYRPLHWNLNLENIYPFIDACMAIFPQNIDRVPYEQVGELPVLPILYMYMEDEQG
jgi:uncharacterized protein